jgi:Capsule polysaccharide biosynthesis protein
MHKKPAEPRSFAVAKAYATLWIEQLYRRDHTDLFGITIQSEQMLRVALDSCDRLPELMLFGGFVPPRAGLLSICRALEIDTVHSEDGFFPHYTTIHVDPTGFCWESSLSRLFFRKCTDHQRRAAEAARTKWIQCIFEELPPAVRPPFVLWSLQLVGDAVNRWDLGVDDWTSLIRGFRRRLPSRFQLVLKGHPRSGAADARGLSQLLPELPNTILVPASTDLRTLLHECRAVAGVNSTVLYEARLMFHKPTYVCGKGWFLNHSDLFLPIRFDDGSTELPRLDWVDNPHLIREPYLDDYSNWFLYQLLVRQIGLDDATRYPARLEEHVRRFTSRSFECYGEEIFL